ncbi:hypothetical protein PVAP13_2NG515103 [Panicum virgatum]|uniref:Uncharacterized protein n=1 Tax=Panicum virgatum TaxID=38727 RepID=A0A8T0VR11_PANVG|nr:hypothetical protein PVAP13_2NG515103 [Panicum virgatum]
MLAVLLSYLSACGGGLLELAGRFSPSLSPAASSQPNRWVLRLWPRIYWFVRTTWWPPTASARHSRPELLRRSC